MLEALGTSSTDFVKTELDRIQQSELPKTGRKPGSMQRWQ